MKNVTKRGWNVTKMLWRASETLAVCYFSDNLTKVPAFRYWEFSNKYCNENDEIRDKEQKKRKGGRMWLSDGHADNVTCWQMVTLAITVDNPHHRHINNLIEEWYARIGHKTNEIGYQRERQQKRAGSSLTKTCSQTSCPLSLTAKSW